jgi:4-amino-4-deoxy-L-arabinose transferase-like glycosyltransferase
MHAKVHPPGPIAVLWLFAILLGNGALALSLATMAFATLSVPFLYLWARRITGRRVALTACLLLGFIPSIVLFTATSADALFLPFTLATLWLFHKALDRSKAVQWAAAAGLGYGLMSIMKFTLLGFGAYFAIVALWRMSKGLGVLPVARVAVVMLAAFLAFHGLLYWWSGFDYVGAFMAAKAQFALDQHHLDLMEPRYPGWAFKVLNPLAWFYFAGIPVSLMAIGRVVRRTAPQQTFFYALALVLLALDLLYLARGEGERSALYVFPLVALPAAHRLDELAGEVRSQGLVAATLAFLAFQCWFTETLFYTYW